MTAQSQTAEGYLLLADISGYTKFLTGTELEHGSAIIAELTELIRSRLEPPMRFIKLEGDAVFCHVESAAFGDGERLLELSEACYLAFRNRLRDMELETTCECRACASLGSLDLKFVAHHGRYLIEGQRESVDLSGSDVILAHRLLKNSAGKRVGSGAYVLLSGACLERIPPSLQLEPHVEEYEHFGEIAGGVHDLRPALDRMREGSRVFVVPEDADIEISLELDQPPQVIWQYAVDPKLRLRWQTNFQKGLKTTPNQEGRTGLGALSHCEHGAAGPAIREYVDWRPHHYFTVRFTPLGRGRATMLRALETTELTPTHAGCRYRYAYQLDDPSPLTRLRWLPGRSLVRRVVAESAAGLREVLAEDEEAGRLQH